MLRLTGGPGAGGGGDEEGNGDDAEEGVPSDTGEDSRGTADEDEGMPG